MIVAVQYVMESVRYVIVYFRKLLFYIGKMAFLKSTDLLDVLGDSSLESDDF